MDNKVLFNVALFYKIVSLVVATDHHLNELRHYEIVQPIQTDHLGRRFKRSISTSSQYNHFDSVNITFSGYSREFRLKLTKNRLLLPKMFKSIFQSEYGSMDVQSQLPVANCYYHGELENRRKSMVTISTCNGLRGLIQDEDDEEFFIEPHDDNLSSHILYNMKDLKVKNGTCGHTEDQSSRFRNKFRTLKSRKRRNVQTWNYIELVAVIDHSQHMKWGSSVKVSQEKTLELFNYVDAIYKTLNTRVTVTSVIIWSTKDEINVTSTAHSTLTQFSSYTSNVIHDQMEIYFDNVQLITAVAFGQSMVGLGGVGNICSKHSCAINHNHNSNPAVTSNTIAHELGHNLGFLHIANGCTCSKSPCVMAAYVANSQVKGFSSCSKQVFHKEEENGKYPCLLDYPSTVFGPAKCGDGYKEEGEECDCGTLKECQLSGADKCCNSTTCKLHEGTQCADGACCQNCQFKSKGIICRQKAHNECDLEEYCTGAASHCPRNFYIGDGKSCESGQGYCYEGVCKIHTEQCETLWGPNGYKADDVCFNLNKEGNAYGNCGKNEDGTIIACSQQDTLCGKIQCQAKPNTTIPFWPLLGSKRGIKMVKYISSGAQITCKALRMSFPSELEDPTITFDGTKCAENSICIGHKCTNISTLPNKKCIQECKNGGVCNNNGNCHCPAGYACPFCEQPGLGGSLDSGQGCYLPPTKPPTGQSKLKYLPLLGIVPLALIIGATAICFYRKRRNVDDKTQLLNKPAYTIKHGFENKAYQPNKNSPLDPSNNKKQLLSAKSSYARYQAV